MPPPVLASGPKPCGGKNYLGDKNKKSLNFKGSEFTSFRGLSFRGLSFRGLRSPEFFVTPVKNAMITFIHSTPHIIISHVFVAWQKNALWADWAQVGYKEEAILVYWLHIFLARICINRGIWGDFSLNFRMIRIFNVLINISPYHSVFSELFVKKFWGFFCCVLQAILSVLRTFAYSFPFRALICIFPTICYSGLVVFTS